MFSLQIKEKSCNSEALTFVLLENRKKCAEYIPVVFNFVNT